MGKLLKRAVEFILLILFLCIIALCVRCSVNPDSKIANNGTYETTQNLYNTINAEELDLHEATVIRVVDGDTIIVNIEDVDTRVRLIGVDTPESVNPDESKNTPEGEKASEITKKLLPTGTTVWLEYDKDQQDDYGRTLAYVWLDNNFNGVTSENLADYMLNAKLLKLGTAEPMFIAPNLKYEPEFSDIKIQESNNK